MQAGIYSVFASVVYILGSYLRIKVSRLEAGPQWLCHVASEDRRCGVAATT